MSAAETPRTGVRSMLPGFYPPRPDELKRLISDGLVVLDTNALLDVYRFTEDARTDYVRALSLLGDRLWIPHQTAKEFFEGRTSVIRSRRTERETFDAKLDAALDAAINVIHGYAYRRGIDAAGAREITGLVAEVRDSIHAKLDEVVEAGAMIDPDSHLKDDPIFQQIEELIDGRIGKVPDPRYLADRQKEWQVRASGHVPPGYRDTKKPDQGIGDYLVWYQTLEEAKRRRTMPILMICNERKPDWVRRDGDYSGPRPELVKEMRDYAQQNFHLVDVHDFLTLANEHLSAHVSETTVDEASRLNDEDDPTWSSRGETADSRTGFRPLAHEIVPALQYAGGLYDTSALTRHLFGGFDTTALIQPMLGNSAAVELASQIVNYPTSGLNLPTSADIVAAFGGMRTSGDLIARGRDMFGPAVFPPDGAGVNTTSSGAPAPKQDAVPKRKSAKRTAAKGTAKKKRAQ